jgi:hypothetical protein
VRQAQQTLGIIMMVLFIGPFLFIQMLDSDERLRLAAGFATMGSNRIVGWAILGLAAAALALNLMAFARFRRGKLALD